ncbi:MAG TPA: 4Fe-4S dicluster domain-containing protein [Anaerolineae bacterium]|nr:4Fe-4S dicluster domain-containing protein [Anaerolineae bacterium]
MTTQAVPVSTETTSNRRTRWLRGLREFLLHAILQDRVIQRVYPGLMHLMIFWGMVIQLLGTVIVILQYPLFLPIELPWPRGSAYLGFELIMDLGGLMIVVGVLMAVLRRLIRRPSYLINRWDDWYSLALLFIIALLGFSTEGVRLMAVSPEWRAWSPIGNLFAQGFTAAGLDTTGVAGLHDFLFWAHIAIALLFIASLPFTKLRHMISGSINIIFRPDHAPGALEPIEDIETAEKLGVGEIDEFQSNALLMIDACVQCGRCEDVCPSTFSGMPFSPRAILSSLYETMRSNLISSNGSEAATLLGDKIKKETPWLCTTCGACISTCPLFIDPVLSVIELRRYLTLTTGDVPGPVGETLTQMERRGNPWGLPKENYAPYLKELGVRILQPGDSTDILLYLGCAFGYDNRSQQAGRALISLLKRAEVDFAVLGSAEGCCGETARRLGNEYVFQVMAAENIATFESVSFSRIVTPCAHGYNTLKNEYPQFGGNYTVLHHTEFLSELIAEGRLAVNHEADHQVHTYHDACYIGRYNQIFDEPRNILTHIPALELTEMPRNRKKAFCCGGGGGHMWMEIDPNTRINHRRLAEAVDDAKADVVVTGCPYCLIMFDDAIRSKGLGEEVAVKDIAEILITHIEE